MERKIYEAPETEVFVLEVNRMLGASLYLHAVTDVNSNFENDADDFEWGGGSSSVYARSKERGGDDFDWDLGF